MLPLPVTAERLQLVPGRRGHDAQFRRGMQLQQFPQRDALERAEAPGMLISEKLLGFFRREALNHTRSILRITLYVKGYDSKVGTGTALLGFELKTTPCSRAEAPHPNAARGRFSEVHGLPIGTQSHRFIVLAL